MNSTKTSIFKLNLTPLAFTNTETPFLFPSFIFSSLFLSHFLLTPPSVVLSSFIPTFILFSFSILPYSPSILPSSSFLPSFILLSSLFLPHFVLTPPSILPLFFLLLVLSITLIYFFLPFFFSFPLSPFLFFSFLLSNRTYYVSLSLSLLITNDVA